MIAFSYVLRYKKVFIYFPRALQCVFIIHCEVHTIKYESEEGF